MSASVSPFRAPTGSPDFPDLEQQILRFWEKEGVYAESLRRRGDAPSFVFFEGPPTANGLPHPGHCLTRSIKDLFPRYKTMRGYRCFRKAGWDTHGLPVEVEVGKELGIHSKEEIEAYGVEPFIQKCQQSVFRYMQEWRNLTRRLGFWVDLDEAYVTYHQELRRKRLVEFEESVRPGLLYQGHKIVWWWAQGGTALSAGEVGQGYREVADPASTSACSRFSSGHGTESARLDHDPLDVAEQHVRRRPSRARIRVCPRSGIRASIGHRRRPGRDDRG